MMAVKGEEGARGKKKFCQYLLFCSLSCSLSVFGEGEEASIAMPNHTAARAESSGLEWRGVDVKF